MGVTSRTTDSYDATTAETATDVRPDWSSATATSDMGNVATFGYEEGAASVTSSYEGWFRLDDLVNGTVSGVVGGGQREVTSAVSSSLPASGVGETTEDDLVVCRWGLTHRSFEVMVDWRVDHRLAWLMHTYGFACLFFMLAFYAFFSILNLRAQLSTRPYMSSINVFLCLLGASRAICFLVDPYDYKGLMPETIGWILFELAFPCLISAFGLIQLAFLQLTRLKLGPSQLRSKSCISLIITTHFCFTIAVNIMLSFDRPDFQVFCFIAQTVFVLWGMGLCVTFLFGGYRMMRMLRHAPASMFQRSDSSGFENKVLALGMLANCHSLAAMTAAAAAAAPSFLAAPKIRITDENEQTYSYVSDNSQLSSSQNLHNAGLNDVTADGPRDSSPGRRVAGSAIYTVSEDAADVAAEDEVPESARMLPGGADNGSGQRKSNSTGNRERRDRPIVGKRVMTNGGVVKPSSGAVTANGSVSKPSAGGRVKLGDSLEMNLLPRAPAAPRIGLEAKQDLTLVSILNHIAYVNQSVDDMGLMRRLQATCKAQVERVLHGTYASSALGLLLCLLEVCRMYGPAIFLGRISPWTWFAFLSIHRLVELAMGCFMANITKQPVNRHQYPYPCHMKHRGGGLYF